LSQRWQNNRENIEAIVKIGPEPALLHGFLKIAVAGGNDAHVDFHRAAAAEWLELVLLKDSQQFHLRVRRKLADLVEE